MKRKMALLLAAVQLLCYANSAAAEDAVMPASEEIMAKIQKAADPDGKSKTVFSAEIKAKLKMFDGAEGNLNVIVKKPDLIRIQVQSGDSLMLRAYNGKTAWELSGKAPLRNLAPEELDSLRFQAYNILPDSNFDELFSKMEPQGSAEIAGGKCYKVLCTPKEQFKSSPLTLYVDQKTFFVLKSEQKQKIRDQETEMATSFEDYENCDGIMMPMIIVSEADGKIREVSIESVEWNPELDESIFNPPAKLEKY